MMKDIAKKIRQGREKKKWTQEMLAKVCDCSVKTISRAENGSSDVSKETLKLLANALEINIDSDTDKLQIQEINSVQSMITSILNRQLLPKLIKEKLHLNEIEFILDEIQLEKMAEVIKFVILIEQLSKHNGKFKSMSEKLEIQYNIGLALEKLKKEEIAIFYRLHSEIYIHGKLTPDEYFNDYNELKSNFKDYSYDNEWVYKKVDIPIFYIYNFKNPIVKTKNHHRYINVNNDNYQHLKNYRQILGINEEKYLNYKPFFTPEEREQLDKKFLKEISEELRKKVEECNLMAEIIEETENLTF